MFVRVFLTLCLVVISACAPRMAPAGPGATTPQLTDTAFITSDGTELKVRRWLPEGDPKAVVLAVHGFNDYSKAFDKVPGAPGVGPFLAARGVAVYAYDQRGFGTSPYHGLWPGDDVMVRDFKEFAIALKARHPTPALYGLGESMGGAVVMTSLAEGTAPPLDGVILAAPAVWGKSTMPVIYRAALWLGTRIVPGWRPTGEGLGRLASDNLDALRDNGRDPLFIKRTRIDSVYGLSELMDEALDAADEMKMTPVLYLYGHNDQIIPKKPTKEALKALSEAKTPVHTAFYPAGWHMILRDKEASTVLTDVAAFIDNPAAPLPSGADVNALARLQDAKECPPC